MRLSLRRPIASYQKVRRLVTLAIRNNPIQMVRLKHNSNRYLNIGCGANIFPGYINIDSAWRPGIDLCWDITRRMPMPDATIEGIYTEHCLEHISYDQCLLVLEDLYRILRDDGTIRIVVPDAGMYLDLYHEARNRPDVKFPTLDDSEVAQTPAAPSSTTTPMVIVNRIFRDFGHRFAYDFDTLESMLQQVGFRHVFRQTFGEGRDQHLLIDSAYRRPQSLYVDAVK